MVVKFRDAALCNTVSPFSSVRVKLRSSMTPVMSLPWNATGDSPQPASSTAIVARKRFANREGFAGRLLFMGGN